jgi:hypothetical protein
MEEPSPAGGSAMNLFLALAWLLLGVAVLAWQAITGDDRWYFPAGSVRISYAWLMFLFTLYNLARWRTTRASRSRRHALAVRRRDALWRDRPAPQEPLNPDFDFGEKPPPRTDVTDRPAGPSG